MACLFRIDRLCDLNCHIDKLDSDSINVMKRFKFTPQWSVILESAKTIINFKRVHDEWNWFANYCDIWGYAKQLCIRFVRHSLCLYVCLSQVFVTCSYNRIFMNPNLDIYLMTYLWQVHAVIFRSQGTGTTLMTCHKFVLNFICTEQFHAMPYQTFCVPCVM